MGDIIQQESPLVQIELGESGANAPEIEENHFSGLLICAAKPITASFCLVF